MRANFNPLKIKNLTHELFKILLLEKKISASDKRNKIQLLLAQLDPQQLENATTAVFSQPVGHNELVKLTLLAAAVTNKEDDIELIKLLLPTKSISAPNQPSALAVACHQGKIRSAEYLINQCADVNEIYYFEELSSPKAKAKKAKIKCCSSPLILSTIKNDQPDLVKLLILNNADILFKDHNEEDALSIARKLKRNQSLLLLEPYHYLKLAAAEFEKGDEMNAIAVNSDFARACLLNRDLVIDYLAYSLERINKLKPLKPNIESEYKFIPHFFSLLVNLLKTPTKQDIATSEQILDKIIPNLLGYNAEAPGDFRLFPNNKAKEEFIDAIQLIKTYDHKNHWRVTEELGLLQEINAAQQQADEKLAFSEADLLEAMKVKKAAKVLADKSLKEIVIAMKNEYSLLPLVLIEKSSTQTILQQLPSDGKSIEAKHSPEVKNNPKNMFRSFPARKKSEVTIASDGSIVDKLTQDTPRQTLRSRLVG